MSQLKTQNFFTAYMPAGTITALRAQAKDAQRVNVFVDDAFALGVSLNTISTEGLYVGKVLSDEEYARLEHTESVSKALQAGLRLLEARPRSTSELRDRLRRKDFAEEAIEAAILRLTNLGMLDDAAFARLWVENRQASRPRGLSALREELRRKGVDRTLVEATLSDDTLTGGEDERAMTIARGALRKYAASPNRVTFQRRMGGYLQRRGFGFDAIGPILDTLWNELKGAAEEDIEIRD
jgi:regulatory protein